MRTILGIFSALLFAGLQAEECKLPEICCKMDPCCNVFWVTGELLYWKIQNAPEPVPLVTQNTDDDALAIGDPGVTVVLGGQDVIIPWHFGGRFSLGWFNEKCCRGIEANYFFLAKTSKSQTVQSSGLDGSPFLGVPFFNVVTGEEDATIIASSEAEIPFSGTATLKISNWMQGAEFNGILSCCNRQCGCDANVLAGFRYLNFNEKLNFTVLSPYVEDPDIWTVVDKFQTTNNFIGGQLGFNLECECNCAFFNIASKMALGANFGQVNIAGSFTTNNFNGLENPQAFVGGIFTQLTNIGNHKFTVFSIVPEVDINVGYRISCFGVRAGYTFLYASSVFRPGNEIDRRINPTQSAEIEATPTPALEGDAFPVVLGQVTGMWAQGVSAGIDFSF